MSIDLQTAINTVNNLNSGEKFCVRDLFLGYEWNRVPRGKRMNLGTLFLHEVETNLNTVVRKLKKNSANQQVYEKI
ncbi:single-stranded DNA-binding protein [Ilyobacter sp.]|uniref:single-stranded DNA-binding protein n=1 Tax=Ilyobacter sp. TaxID=3100343 RepID=UPI0035629666